MTTTRSLTSKITAFLSLLIIFLIMTLGYVTFSYFERQLKATIAQNQFSMTAAFANEIDQKLLFAHQLLITIAKEVPESALSDPDQAQLFLDNQTILHRIFDNHLLFFTPQGKLFAESPFLPDRRGLDYSYRPYYKNTVDTLAPFIAEPYISSLAAKHPAVTMTVPIFDAKGNLAAIMLGSMDLMGTNILHDLSKVIIGQTGYLYLTTGESRLMIMHPDAERIIKPIQPGSNLLYDQAVAGFEGTGETVNSYGIRMLTSYKHLKVNGWILGANYPIAEAHRIIIDLQKRYVEAAVVGIISILLIVYYLIKRMTNPLVVFTRHVETLHQKAGAGKLLDLKTNDEIGTLSHAFNRMVGELDRQTEELQQSETRYRTIYDSSNEAIFIHDLQAGAILDVNIKACEMFGYEREEILQLDVGDLSSGEPSYTMPDALGWISKAAQGNPQFFEWRAKGKTGRVFWVEVKMQRVVIDSVERILVTINDISVRKRADEEAAVLQAQLNHAQKMESIGTLAGGIAHDFNNILGAIIGYTEIAIDDLRPETMTARHLTKVLGASHRAATLVKQILAFSRQANIERIPLKPVHIIKEAIKLLRPSLPSTITIKHDINSSTRSIIADPTQVHQILMNLCTNAFHAMEQTGGTLEIILKDCEFSGDDLQQKPEIQPGKFVLLSIGDTGVGIEAAILDKIFDPYFTTKEVGKGTGMGLAITHGIVTSYGGFITCEKNCGKGTIFHVYFPAIEQEVVSEDAPAEVIPSGTEHILWVDDEEILADFGKTMLEHLGYNVTSQTSSLDALAIFQSQPERFDAVITDQTMPGMTGIDLAKRLLQIRPNLPIILCTGYSTLISEEQVIAEGLKGFVMKPLTRAVIATLLRKVLDEGRLSPDQENIDIVMGKKKALHGLRSEA